MKDTQPFSPEPGNRDALPDLRPLWAALVHAHDAERVGMDGMDREVLLDGHADVAAAQGALLEALRETAPHPVTPELVGYALYELARKARQLTA